jgi:hypothetical protein
MEKTVSVKTESDTVKVAVITSQNKIVTQPTDETHVQLESSSSEKVETQQAKRSPTNRINAHVEHKANDETDKAISFINN